MRNLKLTIEYDGTDYAGWQAQRKAPKPKRKTIQETIEGALQKILQEDVRLFASGRTDAGAHAQAQVANFKTGSGIPAHKLRYALNGLLPADIKIAKVEEAQPHFHSRFSAKAKTYRYTILNRAYPSALLRNRVYFYPYPLNIKLMRKEAKALLGRHNFKSFQASDKKERHSVRTIKKIKVEKSSRFIYIDIEADGFLYNMARNIAGALLEVGRGRFAPGALRKILRLKDRRFAGPALPAKGLCLVRVKY